MNLLINIRVIDTVKHASKCFTQLKIKKYFFKKRVKIYEIIVLIRIINACMLWMRKMRSFVLLWTEYKF